MTNKREVKARLIRFTTYYHGGQMMRMKAKIYDGPTSLLNREVAILMSFDEIKNLYAVMVEAEKTLVQDNKRLARINAGNSGE